MGSDRKRIAKNATFLYVRMLVVILVQLYTTRILFDVLGDSQYGLYTLIAGIVILFNFMNTTMSGATSRFLTYELGTNDKCRLKATFETAFFLHIMISLVLLIVCETVGVWYVNNKMVIPEGALLEANVLFQFSVFSVIFKTIQVPFNASLLSHERMGIYARIEIANVLLILSGAILLKYWPGEKLVFYGAWVLCVAVFIFCIYSAYCIRHFKEASFSCKYDRKMLAPMLRFSGWDLYGNFCVTARTQGLNMILNLFFGTVVNAAAGVATNIQTAILSFGTNVIYAFRPQIIKQYAAGNISEMNDLMQQALKYSLLLFAMVAVPLYIEIDFVFEIWLGTIPKYAVELSRITIITGFATFITTLLTIGIHATGNVKKMSILGGTAFIVTLPLSYLLLLRYDDPSVAYYAMLLMAAIVVVIDMVLLKKQIPGLDVLSILTRILLPTGAIICMCAFFTAVMSKQLGEGFMSVILTVLTYCVSLSLLSIIFLIPRTVTKKMIGKIISVVQKKN